MAITLDDFHRLQEKVQKLQQDRDKAAGALDQLQKQLKKDFGCSTIEAGETLLEKMKATELKVYKKYIATKKTFEEKFKDQLQ